MNDAQKLDAILTAVQNPPAPPAATVDVTALTAALVPAITAALQPLFDAVNSKLTDIQGEVDEPVAPAPAPAPEPTPVTA